MIQFKARLSYSFTISIVTSILLLLFLFFRQCLCYFSFVITHILLSMIYFRLSSYLNHCFSKSLSSAVSLGKCLKLGLITFGYKLIILNYFYCFLQTRPCSMPAPLIRLLPMPAIFDCPTYDTSDSLISYSIYLWFPSYCGRRTSGVLESPVLSFYWELFLTS